jgi:acetylornithine deacetylase/succinyl-diaminopimelate desuccinylase family protein
MSYQSTLSNLVRINSVNTAYENGPGEAEISRFIKAFFDERGIETWTQEVFPDRHNVIARLPGRQTDRRVILEAHVDTASIQGMTIPPFEPTVKDGKMYGRGSCDTKAGLATMMHAVADLHERHIVPPCEVWMAAVVDEEFSFRGVVKLCENLVANAALVAEPTEMRAVIASKGVLRWRIVAYGKSAHSSKVHLGVNSIHHMARLLVAVENLHNSLSGVVHPLLGPGTGNVGLIAGGTQVNFVPDQCAIQIDRRLLPSESGEQVLAEYQSIIDSIQHEDPTARFEMEPPMILDIGLSTDADSQVAQCSSKVLQSMGLSGELSGVPFGSDASKLARQGVPSVIIGPGSIDRAHAAVEYVELDQLDQAFEFYRNFVLQFE